MRERERGTDIYNENDRTLKQVYKQTQKQIPITHDFKQIILVKSGHSTTRNVLLKLTVLLTCYLFQRHSY